MLAQAMAGEGATLAFIASTESSASKMHEACKRLKEALRLLPLDWPVDRAKTQNFRGLCLLSLAKYRAVTDVNATIIQAIDNYRVSLKVLTRERFPIDWAQTEVALGFALTYLGNESGSLRHLEEAGIAFRAALTEIRPERAAFSWVATKAALGNVLVILGTKKRDEAIVAEAVHTYQSLLSHRDLVPSAFDAFIESQLRSAQERLSAIQNQSSD